MSPARLQDSQIEERIIEQNQVHLTNTGIDPHQDNEMQNQEKVYSKTVEEGVKFMEQQKIEKYSL